MDPGTPPAQEEIFSESEPVPSCPKDLTQGANISPPGLGGVSFHEERVE